MSYFADHLAWQQRVAQEFKAQSTTLDNQMYQMQNGQWYNYPDLINYLKTSQAATTQQNMARSYGQGFNQQPGSVPQAYGTQQESRQQRTKSGYAEDQSGYGYAPKSKVLYQRNPNQKRSKTGGKSTNFGVGPYVKAPSQIGSTGSRFDKQSTLSKNNMARFNEAIPEGGPKSQIRSQVSRVSAAKSGQVSVFSTQSKQQKKMKIYQAVEKLDDNEIDKISVIIDNADKVGETQPDEEIEQIAQEERDNVEELPEGDNLTSVSQVGPTGSQISQMSGRTYISTLQKQLNEEKDARLRLECELDDLKKISSEITSQLSQMQREKEEKA